jgi:hypothetical protein
MTRDGYTRGGVATTPLVNWREVYWRRANGLPGGCGTLGTGATRVPRAARTVNFEAGAGIEQILRASRKTFHGNEVLPPTTSNVAPGKRQRHGFGSQVVGHRARDTLAESH